MHRYVFTRSCVMVLHLRWWPLGRRCLMAVARLPSTAARWRCRCSPLAARNYLDIGRHKTSVDALSLTRSCTIEQLPYTHLFTYTPRLNLHSIKTMLAKNSSNKTKRTFFPLIYYVYASVHILFQEPRTWGTVGIWRDASTEVSGSLIRLFSSGLRLRV